MKKILLCFLSVMLFSFANAQTKRTEVKDAKDKYANVEIQYLTTTKLPRGTIFKNGNVMLRRGYTASYADNNQVVIIKKAKAGGNTGAFSCDCERGTGGCGVGIDGNKITCLPKNGCTDCRVTVVVDPKGTAITKSGIDWKKLIVPSANIQRQKTEDPDQGGEIIRKPVKRATSPVKQ